MKTIFVEVTNNINTWSNYGDGINTQDPKIKNVTNRYVWHEKVSILIQVPFLAQSSIPFPQQNLLYYWRTIPFQLKMLNHIRIVVYQVTNKIRLRHFHQWLNIKSLIVSWTLMAFDKEKFPWKISSQWKLKILGCWKISTRILLILHKIQLHIIIQWCKSSASAPQERQIL